MRESVSRKPENGAEESIVLEEGVEESIVLEEELPEDYESTEEEILEYAKWLGMDTENEKDLFWIVREGLKAPLPENWKPCKSPDGEIYYFNFASGESVWDHPCDEYYRKVHLPHRPRPQSYIPCDLCCQVYEEEKGKKKLREDTSAAKGLFSSIFIADVFSPFAALTIRPAEAPRPAPDGPPQPISDAASPAQAQIAANGQ